MGLVVNGVRLGVEDIKNLSNSAKVAQALENKWDRIMALAIKKAAEADADRVTIGSEPQPPNFERILIEHYFAVQIAALRLAESERELEKRAPRLAAPKTRTLKDLLEKYDAWRKGLYKPKSVSRVADSIKRAYRAAIKSAWNAHSEAFRNGDVYTQKSVIEAIQDAAGVVKSRAQTIVRTETTRYYNDVRRDYYDEHDDITHYLFLAVRDKATTHWCSANKSQVPRGRSGLVYEKGSKYLNRETPPIHWNCRSELLPLNRFNPTHQELIKDASIQRAAVQCVPLPLSWNK